MNNRLPCHIVKDLLPQYAEHLLSKESEQDVKAHLDECEDCNKLYRLITKPQKLPQSDLAEVDFLKKVRASKNRVLVISALAVAVLACALFGWYRYRSSKASVSYDAASKTMVIYGRDDDTEMKLPKTANEAEILDAQYDSFHLNVWLPLLRTDGLSLDTYLPQYLSRTNRSLKFLRSYMQENCADEDLASRAQKYVSLRVNAGSDYSWDELEDTINLDIGSYYWHREELYILSLINTQHVDWKQLGYAWYLGTCIDPYSETLASADIKEIEKMRYYDAYVKAGGTDQLSPANYRILNDAVSYTCLKQGMNWGTAYESKPLKNTLLYHGPAKTIDPGNEMSVCMVTSLIAYLSDQYGFETVTSFCFGEKNFEEAFGISFETAYENWSAKIIEICE